ncbi:rCG37818 [Rattus norvegicus]|uniref:RCG37818 n=1 Tax=Rattus norvegicus TaxID=10116 RepID=A6K5X5_RAT|nr:rCG37818 [Rattus norvegicus]
MLRAAVRKTTDEDPNHH